MTAFEIKLEDLEKARQLKKSVDELTAEEERADAAYRAATSADPAWARLGNERWLVHDRRQRAIMDLYKMQIYILAQLGIATGQQAGR